MPIAFAISELTLSSVGHASPAHPTAHLVYTLGPSTESCPTASAMQAAVVQRLGYDPFDPDSAQRVDAGLRREHGVFIASVSIRTADGGVRQREPLTSAASDCSEIASSLALAISIAIDPLSLVRPTPTETPPPPPPPSMVATVPPAAPEKEKSPAPARPPARIGWRVGVGILGSLGALPEPSVGVMISGGVEVSRFVLNLETRYDLPVSKEGPSGGVVTESLLLGTLAPCWEPGPFIGCALLSGGGLFGSGAFVTAPQHDDSLYFAMGLRAGIQLPPTGTLRGRLQLDVYAPLRSTTVRIAQSDVWSSPHVFATAGLVITFGGP